MKQKLPEAELRKKIRDLEEDYRKILNERTELKNFSSKLFKTVVALSPGQTVNSVWVLNELALIFNKYGMPAISWTKEDFEKR